MKYLFGASGHGRVILDICLRAGQEVDAFVDSAIKPEQFGGIPCYLESELHIEAHDSVLISIGSNAIRKKLVAEFPCKWFSAIDPSLIISSSASIGEGTAVMPGVIINALTKVGNHCIINTGAVIEHECFVGDFAHISPNATLCGNVEVGEGTHIGAGAVVLPNIKIGKWSVIGAGAVVTKDIPDHVVVAGNPARWIRDHE